MQCVILAGGLGTRLRARVGPTQKCMALVGGTPFLDILIGRLAENGASDVVLALGYKAESVCRFFRHRQGPRILFSIERELLGTAGAIRYARPLLNEPSVLVLNGDTYAEVSYGEMWRWRPPGSPNLFGVVASVWVEDASEYGTLKISPEGRIEKFREKRDSEGGWINAGAYLFPTSWISTIPEGKDVSLEREWLPSLLDQGFLIYAFRFQGRFYDLGTPHRLDEFLNHYRVPPALNSPVDGKA